MPEASRPGTRITGSAAPPSPAASMMMIAPITGEPKTEAMAAKLPAAASTASIGSGASLLTSRTAKMARPAPIAISGPSGPRTRPSPSVASAARTTPGTSSGSVGFPVLMPASGSWPPWPGSRTMAKAVTRPAMASTGSGHHQGASWYPSASGREWNTQCWSLCTNHRKIQQSSDTKMPMIAANTSTRR
jgi:hypothetical protein